MTGAAPGRIRAVALVVLDSVGIGGAPDAAAFGDEGSATLQHVAAAAGGIELPNLGALGLGCVAEVAGVPPAPDPAGAFGTMVELSAGKDTTSGHWELAGVVLERPFPTYPEGFPPEVMEPFEDAIGSATLGNVPASGTEIIERLGAEHVRTGFPIVYTSADSVFQIAAHVDVVSLERLYEMCRVAREILRGEHEVGRVIGRPFEGRPGAFARTPDRHDFSVIPPQPTVLDEVARAGQEVRGVGKISDIFGGRGVTSSRPTRSNEEGVTGVAEELRAIERGLVFANLVEFDSSYGHRNDPAGYAAALRRSTAGFRRSSTRWGPTTSCWSPPTTGTTRPPPRRTIPASGSRCSRRASRWRQARRSASAAPSPTAGRRSQSSWALPPRRWGSRSRR